MKILIRQDETRPPGCTDSWVATSADLPRRGIGRRWGEALESLIRANLDAFGIEEIVTDEAVKVGDGFERKVFTWAKPEVDSVDVTRCGAAGDGVTDDTAAIADAIEAAASEGKGLCFPAGIDAVKATGEEPPPSKSGYRMHQEGMARMRREGMQDAWLCGGGNAEGDAIAESVEVAMARVPVANDLAERFVRDGLPVACPDGADYEWSRRRAGIRTAAKEFGEQTEGTE